MPSFERYAAVALLFLFAIVAVVMLWDDGGDEPATKPDQVVSRVDETDRARSNATTRRANTSRENTSSRAPISGRNKPTNEVSRASTRSSSTSHGVEPLRRADEADRARERETTTRNVPAAPTKDELEDFAPRLSTQSKDERDRLAIRDEDFLTKRRDGGSDRGAQAKPSDTPASTTRRTNDQAARTASNTTATRTNKPQRRTYVVQSGDVLSKIAQDELGSGGRWKEIADLNGLSEPYTIYEKMVLALPSKVAAPSGTTTSSSAAPKVALGKGQREYVIKGGEMLSVVLERELGTYRRSIALVTQLNPDLDPDNVAEGQRIVLPSRDAIPAGKATTSRPADAGQPTLTAATRGDRVASADNEFVVR